MLLSDVIHQPVRPQARVILRELMDREYVSTDRIADHLWGQREDGGPLTMPKHIVTLVCEIRRALRPGWHIVCRNGVYRMHYEAVERMAA